MFFEIDADEWTKAVSQVRGVALRKTWWRIGHEERFWTPTFLAVMVERVNAKLLESPRDAFEMSEGLPLLASRLRADDCPQGEIGKRSLEVWAWAVRGSACRVVEAVAHAELAFGEAFARAENILPWALAEACRRYAALLIQRQDERSFGYLDRAFGLYEGWPADQANTLVLRGAARSYDSDLTGAVLCFAKAIDLIGIPSTPFQIDVWTAAVHNTALAIAKDDHSTAEMTSEALRLFQVARERLSKNAGYRRRLMTWIEGLLYARLGLMAKAERRLLMTWRWLLRNEVLHLAMIVAFDLITFARQAGEPRQAQYIFETTRQAIAEKGSPEVIEDLEKWMRAEITEQLEIRASIVSQVCRQDIRLSR